MTLTLAATRWKLRRAVGTINEGFAELDLAQRPGKTFAGRIMRGFDCLGHRFGGNDLGHASLGMAKQTIGNFRKKLSRFYEQWFQAPHMQRPELEASIATYSAVDTAGSAGDWECGCD